MTMNNALHLQWQCKMANNTAVIKDVLGPHIYLLIRAQIDLNRLKKPRMPYFFYVWLADWEVHGSSSLSDVLYQVNCIIPGGIWQFPEQLLKSFTTLLIVRKVCRLCVTKISQNYTSDRNLLPSQLWRSTSIFFLHNKRKHLSQNMRLQKKALYSISIIHFHTPSQYICCSVSATQQIFLFFAFCIQYNYVLFAKCC